MRIISKFVVFGSDLDSESLILFLEQHKAW